MLNGILSGKLLGAVIGLILLCSNNLPALAAIPHEDPDALKQKSNSIRILTYYSESLDNIIQKNLPGVETRLTKMPFANLPQDLEEAAYGFADSGMTLARQVVGIDEALSNIRILRAQLRIEEVEELWAQISNNLTQANIELDRTEKFVNITGIILQVPGPSDDSPLRIAYNGVLDRINRIRQLLILAGEAEDSLLRVDASLRSTEITLKLDPTVSFVGDNVSLEGRLTSDNKPLAGRNVDVLVNGARNLTAMTDADGQYRATLTVPYIYLPELDAHALYVPQDQDTSLYRASISPSVKLNALFYMSGLNLTMDEKAYPGIKTTITGEFYYGDSPALADRQAEIYLDDLFIAEAHPTRFLSQEISIPPDIDVGKHTVTLFSNGSGRYSPVSVEGVLNVTRAAPVLALELPGISFIPGSLSLKGRLHSEVGPLSGADVIISLGSNTVDLKSAEDGTFETSIRTLIGPGLFGSQDFRIQVAPAEPWHATLVITRQVLIVNLINITSMLILVVILAIFLPARLRKRMGAISVMPNPPGARGLPAELSPVYSKAESIAGIAEKTYSESGAPRERVFYWYLSLIRIIAKLSKSILRPQQTLREFARENSSRFGPLGKYFNELTVMVERLLYSRYTPTDQDAEQSRKIAQSIEGGLKG